jgi:Fe2+ transport system protein B
MLGLNAAGAITVAQGLSYLILVMAFFPCSATFSILQKEGG